MRILLAAVLLVGIGGRTGESQDRVPMVQRELQTIEGGLSKFEAEQRIIWLKIGDGSEMQFSYTAETSLVGATRQLQVGDLLKVFYEVEDKGNKAMRVEVIPEAAATE